MQNIVTLGEINDALKIAAVTAAQLADMGFAALANKPICEGLPPEESRRLRNAKLYPAESIGQIRVALAQRLAAPATMQASVSNATCQAAPAAVTEPDGWRLVPVDPTEQMEQAAADYLGECVKAWGLWKAMIASAPENAALAATPAAACGSESVLIDGVAYDVPAAVAGELLSLHLDLIAAAPTYIEVRECSDCGHIGINDADGSKAACSKCDWQGDSPVEDKCPDCNTVGTMTAACSNCGARASLLAETTLHAEPIAPAAAAPVVLPEPVGWRHSLTLTLHETEEEVQLADGDSHAQPLFTEQQVRALLAGVSAPAAVAVAVPDGWREKFAADVYADLAAADNQDVPLEEYPARILKVLDSIVGPRHPVVIKWRNDAIRNCIAIAYKYCRDPESHKYLKQDLEALLTAEPAPQQADARDAVTFEQRMSDWQHGDALDAERYRWLRNESWAGYNIAKKKPEVALVALTRDGAGNIKLILAEDAMDTAVDAAIAAAKGE